MKVKKKLKKFNGYKSIREDKDLKFIKRKIKQQCVVTNEVEEGEGGATEPVVTA